MNQVNNIKKELISQNLNRMKYLSLVFIGLFIFVLIIDFSSFNPWNMEINSLYKMVDISFAIISLFAGVFFWFGEKLSLKIRDFVLKIIIILFVLWAVLVSGIDYSSISFSTYISALLLSIFFIYFRPYFSLILIWLSTFTLLALLYSINKFDANFISTAFVLPPINLIASIIAIKNYKEKIISIENYLLKEKLNQELQVTKQNLDSEVKRQTEDLLQANKELKESKNQLSLERDRFAALINNLQSGVFYINTQGNILELNSSLLQILGSPSMDATKAINIFDFQPLREFGYSQKLKKCIETGEIVYGKGEYKTMWDKLIYINYYFVPIFKEGVIVGVLANIEDITEKNKKDEELKKANEMLLTAKEKAEESDNLKTAFLNNMSHEIRTPMNAICGFSKMLNNKSLTDKKREQFVKIINENSDQLLSIITDIITISSLEAKQEQPKNKNTIINYILSDLVSVFREENKNTEIEIICKKTLSDQDSQILTDQTKLNQIITNLLNNSIKFTDKGIIELGYNLINNNLEFYVKDSGIGIPKNELFKIFDRFYQVNKGYSRLYGGNGLGLSISKAFVELLGGKIWAESEIGKGTIFYFTIPYQPINETIKLRPKQTKSYKTFLIAEDQYSNFELLKELLLKKNIKIIHTKNGKETVEICKTNAEIDLILMDIKMPIMSGYDAAKIIKKIRPDIPIIAQSAYALNQEIEKYSGIFDDYITKPIKEKTLLEKLNIYIN